MLEYDELGNIENIVSRNSVVTTSIEEIVKYSMHVDDEEFEVVKKFYLDFEIDDSEKPIKGSFSVNIDKENKKIELCSNHINKYTNLCFVQNFKPYLKSIV